jgi:hypothetical protein
MFTLIILLIAGILTMPGVLLMVFAKSGEQETVAGVILMVAALGWMVGGFCWSIGL